VEVPTVVAKLAVAEMTVPLQQAVTHQVVVMAREMLMEREMMDVQQEDLLQGELPLVVVTKNVIDKKKPGLARLFL
jgi:hypothetical protein